MFRAMDKARLLFLHHNPNMKKQHEFFAIGWSLITCFVLLASIAKPVDAGALDFMSGPDGFAVCTVADIGSTIAATRNGAVEQNPLYGKSFEQHHYAGPVLANLALIGLSYEFRNAISPNAFLAINVLRCGVAGANLRFVF